jgi:PHD/YefM family antitoxin component YafN of YafNO toxin-antitoxin module
MLAIPTQYLVDEQNRKTAVVLSMATYEQLLEDLHDLAMVAERREERPINLTEMIQRLGIHDELQPSVSTSR